MPGIDPSAHTSRVGAVGNETHLLRDGNCQGNRVPLEDTGLKVCTLNPLIFYLIIREKVLSFKSEIE